MAQIVMSDPIAPTKSTSVMAPSIHRARIVFVTGQMAGWVMLTVLALLFIGAGSGPTYPLQLFGSLVLGDRGLVGDNPPAIALGLILNQVALTLLWSFAFWVVIEALRIRKPATLAMTGFATGIVAQLVGVNLLMAPVMQSMHGHNIWAEHMPPAFSWVAHLTFGLCLASYPAVHRYLDRDAPPKLA